MGLLNGISQAGATVAQYVGNASVLQQKADLQNQSMQLADQLAGARESAGRIQAGDIAAAAADKQQAFQAGQTDKTEAGANARNAANNATSLATTQISNQGLPKYRTAQTADLNTKNSLATTQLGQVNQITAEQNALADEASKPNPDPDVIAAHTAKIAALGTTTQTIAAAATSAENLAKVESQNATAAAKQLEDATGKLNDPFLDDSQRAKQQEIVTGLQEQVRASRARASSLVDQARGMMTPGAHTTAAGSSSSAAAQSPAPPNAASSGMINSAPTPAVSGTPTGVTGAPSVDGVTASSTTTPLPSSAAVAPAATGGSSPVKLPGDTAGLTSLEAIKAARPELNVDKLASLPPASRGLVMAMIDGRETLPALSGKTNATALNLRAIATQVDPTLDEASAAGRLATRKAFVSGAEARNITSLNTTLGHVGVLMDKFKDLNNSSFPAGNTVMNYLEEKAPLVGGDGRQTAVRTTINAVASKAHKVFAGASGGSLSELEKWESSFDPNGSPDQMKQSLGTLGNLLQSRLEALGDQYNRGMGITRDPITFLNPHSTEVLNRINGTPSAPIVGSQTGGPSPSFSSAPRFTASPTNARPALSDIFGAQ